MFLPVAFAIVITRYIVSDENTINPTGNDRNSPNSMCNLVKKRKWQQRNNHNVVMRFIF